jgi:hypothetical protein
VSEKLVASKALCSMIQLKLNSRNLLEDLATDGRIFSKWTFEDIG